MSITKRVLKNAIYILVFFIAASGCKKLSQPAMPDYPKDIDPRFPLYPGGPLKFYAAFEAPTNPVDSIRANFGILSDASLVTGGVRGSCIQLNGAKNGYVWFPSANDYGASTNFTISFWINITMAQKDNNHAVGVLAFASSSNFWSNICFYADNNAKSPSDSMDLKIHFGGPGGGDNWDFANYNFQRAWPKMYDGNWHQVAFTYDASAKVGTVYRDGVQFDKKTNETIAFTNASKVILGGFQEADGIQGNYAGNTWMAGFPGKMDQVRLYGTALSASDILAIYNNKQ